MHVSRWQYGSTIQSDWKSSRLNSALPSFPSGKTAMKDQGRCRQRKKTGRAPRLSLFGDKLTGLSRLSQIGESMGTRPEIRGF